MGSLKDAVSADSEQPEYAKNAARAARDEFLVVEGTCTHLGCLPKARFEKALPELGADWPGGFFAPAMVRGSTSPAACSTARRPRRTCAFLSTSFRDDKTLVIGVDATTGAA